MISVLIVAMKLFFIKMIIMNVDYAKILTVIKYINLKKVMHVFQVFQKVQ